MSRLKRLPTPSPASVLALVAVVLSATGLAVAAIPDSKGVIHACYAKSGGALRVVSGKKCEAGEKKLAWNKQGPRGIRGLRGLRGPAGPTTIRQSGLRAMKIDAPEVTLARAGTLRLVARCLTYVPGNARALLVLENTSSSATAQWDSSTASTGYTDGSTMAPGDEALVVRTDDQGTTSGQGLAQAVVSAFSADKSHLAVQAFAAAGGSLVGTTNNCEFAATETQGAPGS